MTMRFIEEFFRDTFQGANVPNDIVQEFLSELPSQLLWDKNTHRRSEMALDELSTVRPLPAYALRSLGLLRQLQMFLHIENFGEADYLYALIGGIGEYTQRSFDTTTMAAAKSLGKRTVKQAKRFSTRNPVSATIQTTNRTDSAGSSKRHGTQQR